MELSLERLSSEDSDISLSEVIAKRARTTRRSYDEVSTDSSIEHHSIFSSSEDEESETTHNASLTEWSNPVGRQPQLTPFTGAHGLKLSDRNCQKAGDIYSLLLDDRILGIIEEGTNRNAEKMLSGKWKPTDKTEMKRFFGLIMWMGIVRLPQVHLYWSKDAMYTQTVPSSVLSRNRFAVLLRMLHISDDELKVVTDMLNENFRSCCDPGENLCVADTLIHVQGKFCAKIFKLLTKPGYTVGFFINKGEKSSTIALSLCDNILDKGHTLCTNDCYTSVDLARQLVARNTHLIGMIRSNHRDIPKHLLAKKLKRGEHTATESSDGITLLKWNDKHDVFFLSTKHSDETIRKYDCFKPKIVLDYNEGKSYLKVSEKMSPYCHPLRKSLKWYQKILLELFLNTAVVNAWIIYNTIVEAKIPGFEFKKRLAMEMMSRDEDNLPVMPEVVRHEIKKKEGKFDSVRKRCKVCYEENVKKFGSQTAKNRTVKVVTYCDGCPDKWHLCLPCFNKVHCNMPP